MIYVKPRMAGNLFEPIFVNDIKKIRLVSSMRNNLNASVEAEKSAVLADTDEASRSFADQASQFSSAVENARMELGALVDADKMTQEQNLFQEFSDCWEKFRQIDQELLQLAVQNTNLKAFELSFGSAQASIKQLEEFLDSLMEADVSNDKSCRITKLSYQILTAALKIHALQSPHIAESRPEKMDEIETSIQMYNEQITRSLDALSFFMNPKDKALHEKVKSIYSEFWKTNTEIMQLSRQNSNVRSLALSLGQKRKTTVQCQEVLSVLEETIQSKAYKATR
jgi:hypothetical protein